MQRPIPAYLLALAAALLQGYFLSATAQSWLPNLVLIVVFWWALQARGRLEAVALGLWSGFWLDVASNIAFGWHMVWFAGFALLIHWCKEAGQPTTRVSFWVTSLLLGSLVYNLSLWLSLVGAAGGWQRPWAWTGQWGLEALATLGLAYLINGYLKLRLRSH